MDVDFNPQYVKEYRLIGYDNKVGALTDSLSVIEGGEIGSGQSLLSLFEITPEESNKETAGNIAGGRFADIKLDYKHSNDSTNCHYIYRGRREFTPFDKLEKSYRFSAAVVMFGSMLRYSPYLKNTNWNDVVTWATAASDDKDILQQEFVNIVQQARTLYSKMKKKKGGNTSQ
jgi:Ca-activated chloride channel family protein